VGREDVVRIILRGHSARLVHLQRCCTYPRSFLSQLAEIHVDPTVSDPKRIYQIPDDATSDGEGRPKWDRNDLETVGEWRGLWKDVGIFTHAQWDIIMAKCLTSMGQSMR
jgi:hypothetical protein